MKQISRSLQVLTVSESDHDLESSKDRGNSLQVQLNLENVGLRKNEVRVAANGEETLEHRFESLLIQIDSQLYFQYQALKSKQGTYTAVGIILEELEARRNDQQEYFIILTLDQQRIKVNRKITKMSKLLRDAAEIEENVSEIPCYMVHSTQFQQIVAYCELFNYEKDIDSIPEHERSKGNWIKHQGEREFIENFSKEEIRKLLHAANNMNIPTLFELCRASIASNLESDQIILSGSILNEELAQTKMPPKKKIFHKDIKSILSGSPIEQKSKKDFTIEENVTLMKKHEGGGYKKIPRILTNKSSIFRWTILRRTGFRQLSLTELQRHPRVFWRSIGLVKGRSPRNSNSEEFLLL